MSVAALNSQLPHEPVSIERLAGNSTLTEQEKIAETSRQFEAILLRQILTETQKSVIKSKFSDNSTAATIYRDMVTNQLADSISKSGAVGLSQSLERQLGAQLHPASTAGTAASAALLPTPQSAPDAVRSPAFEPNSGRPVTAPHHKMPFRPIAS